MELQEKNQEKSKKGMFFSKLSAISCQPSAVSHQLSVISC